MSIKAYVSGLCAEILLKKLKHSKWWTRKGQREDLLKKNYTFYTIYNLHGTIYRPDKTGLESFGGALRKAVPH